MNVIGPVLVEIAAIKFDMELHVEKGNENSAMIPMLLQAYHELCCLHQSHKLHSRSYVIEFQPENI